MSPKLEVDLLIPGLFDRVESWSLNYGQFPEFKGLEQLLNTTTVSPFGYHGYEHTLWKLLQTCYSEGEELPLARQLENIDAGMVCRADPVHLRAGIDDLILVDSAQLHLAAEDCLALEQIVNDHLVEIAGHFSLTATAEGILCFPDEAQMLTTPISQVAGQGIKELMPKGENSGQWHRLMNEFQMLLHETEFNQRRAGRGEAAVNALWIWGMGQQTRLPPTPYDQVVCDDVFSRSLTKSFKLPVAGSDGLPEKAAGRVLVVYTAQLPAAQYDDPLVWQEAAKVLEQTLIEPLLARLQRREISKLRLFPCDGRCFQSSPQWGWRQLFQKRRNLSQQAVRGV